MTSKNILPALIREHNYNHPKYAETTFPYISPLKEQETTEDQFDTSETVGPCPSTLYRYSTNKNCSSHKKIKIENALKTKSKK